MRYYNHLGKYCCHSIKVYIDSDYGEKYLSWSFFGVFSGCSQNFEKIYDCDGVEIIFNDYDRLFVVGGVEFNQKVAFL